MPKRRLALIRHGEYEPASRQLLATPRGDQWDPPLSGIGREQATSLARRLLSDEAPAAIYSSPLARATNTIQPYASRIGREISVDFDLAEAYLGSWETTPFLNDVMANPRLLDGYRNNESMWSLAPGGETDERLRERACLAIEGLLALHPHGDLIVVTHAGVINAYCATILHLDHVGFFTPGRGSINTVNIDGPARSIQYLNDIRHLTEPELFPSETSFESPPS